MKVVSSCILLCLSAVLANATVIFSDSFNYPDGALTNVGGAVWSQHSGGGICEVMSGEVQLMSSIGQDVHAAMTNQPFSAGSGVMLYAGFHLRVVTLPTGAGTYFAHLNTTANHRCLAWISMANAASGMFRLGIGNTTSANNASGQIATDLLTNTVYSVVIRYVTGTGISTIWLNPIAESDASVTASDTPSPSTVSNFSLRQNAGMGTLFLDNLIVGTSFQEVVTVAPIVPPTITSQPSDQTVVENDGVIFSVAAIGTEPLKYQWSSNSIPVAGATNETFTLLNVTTNLSGSTFFVTITNAGGFTNSRTALLTVRPAAVLQSNSIKLVQYNVKGNFAPDWTTNAPQVRAIGRQITYLQPDIITFNEIPNGFRGEMTNWAKDFLSGYDVRVSPGTDGSIRSAIASRFPITRATNYLDGINLQPFGYTNTNSALEIFTRDLFEAQIAVPGFPQPLHVFAAHLKSGTSDSDDAARRAAEASAISNFFVTVFLTGTNLLHPYVLDGDMNEDIDRPATGSKQPIQRLVNTSTGLHLTTPLNPNSHSNFTHSIQGNLVRRYDYIMPSPLLFSNIVSSQVFRTDLLTNPPPPLLTDDDVTASDHLPVVMVFNNPYDKPFQITAINRSNSSLNLTWESVPGQPYRLETSSNFLSWSLLTTNLVATNYSFVFTTNNVSDEAKFFRVYRGW